MSTTMDTQHLEALRQANAVRTAVSHIRRRVAEADRVQGKWLAAGILRELPSGADAVRVLALLMAVRSVGSTKARRWLRVVGVAPDRRLDAMTDRQRSALALLLEEDA